jgi:transposase
MIAPPNGVRVYLACGYTDMRRGAQGLAMLVQQVLAKNPFEAGTVYAFRGRRSNLLKLIWHDGIGLCMLSKRLERGQFIWPMTSTGTVILSAVELLTLLEGMEWRATARNLRPELAG